MTVKPVEKQIVLPVFFSYENQNNQNNAIKFDVQQHVWTFYVLKW